MQHQQYNVSYQLQRINNLHFLLPSYFNNGIPRITNEELHPTNSLDKYVWHSRKTGLEAQAEKRKCS